MPVDLLQMHKAFLAEIAEKRLRLHREIEQLDPVEAYHQRIVDELMAEAKVPPANGKPAVVVKDAARTDITDMRLLTATRHEACRIALEALGGEAKTADIVSWLRERGYGKEFDERIFHNTCFTAMNRKEDIFEKAGRGEWKLAG